MSPSPFPCDHQNVLLYFFLFLSLLCLKGLLWIETAVSQSSARLAGRHWLGEKLAKYCKRNDRINMPRRYLLCLVFLALAIGSEALPQTFPIVLSSRARGSFGLNGITDVISVPIDGEPYKYNNHFATPSTANNPSDQSGLEILSKMLQEARYSFLTDFIILANNLTFLKSPMARNKNLML